MTPINLLGTIRTLALLFIILSVMTACNFRKNNESRKNSTVVSHTNSEIEPIPDSTVQFLVISAVTDFFTHQPPAPIDFRRVEIGYLLSPGNEKLYVLCGEFQSEKNEWESFATIKTSGYEQYIGNQALSFCENTTKAQFDEATLLTELRNKLEELRNNNK